MSRIANYFSSAAILAVAGSLAFAQTPTPQQTREANLKAYVNMMRKDLKKDKVAILTELMALGPEDAAKFWTVYNEYDKAMTRLADERVAFIRMYSDHYSAMTGDVATKIAMGLMDVEARRLEVRKEYFQRLSKTLTPIEAARWLQIEAQIEKVVDLQILASLPIVE